MIFQALPWLHGLALQVYISTFRLGLGVRFWNWSQHALYICHHQNPKPKTLRVHMMQTSRGLTTWGRGSRWGPKKEKKDQVIVTIGDNRDDIWDNGNENGNYYNIIGFILGLYSNSDYRG